MPDEPVFASPAQIRVAPPHKTLRDEVSPQTSAGSYDRSDRYVARRCFA